MIKTRKVKPVKYLLLFALSYALTPVIADIATAGSASQSVIISSNEFENDKEYLLEINLVGVDPRAVTLQPHGQILILEVRQGDIKRNARAGSQNIFYTYSFGDDADMQNISKLHSGNKIRISIPKR
jgi:HSP20 family molecular chaperone IbpA